MVDILKLQQLINKKGFSDAYIAKALNISIKALNERYKKAVFGADEIQKLVNLLELSNPEKVFFIDSSA